MAEQTLLNLKLFAPELAIVGTLVFLFLVDGFFEQTRNTAAPLIVTLVGCALAALLSESGSQETTKLIFSGAVSADGFTSFFRYIFLASCALTTYLCFGTKEIRDNQRVEVCLLLLCVTFGMCLMAGAKNLLTLFLGIETVSIVSYALAGFSRENLRSNEASFKYLVYGSLASGVMIYGFSLLYGYAGSMNYGDIATYLRDKTELPFIVIAATVMVFTGLAFKISAFPMHFWTPDVYEGTPTPIATFFSVGPKAAGFAAILRFYIEVYSLKAGNGEFAPLKGFSMVDGIAFVSVITMFVGNLSALAQTNVKRILAYSSIAHVGYVLLGLVSYEKSGLTAILFYIVAYYFMNFGAFWVVSIVGDLKGSEELDAFRGIGWKMPVLGTCMAIFLFSLTGIPVFSGFIGKFLLFGALLKAKGFLWLAILGVLNSVISLYYYAKIVKAMWLDKPEEGAELTPVRLSVYHAIGLILLALPTVVLGIYFSPLLVIAERSLAVFLS